MNPTTARALRRASSVIKEAQKITAAGGKWDSKEDFIAFLEETLIPDLKESGNEFTAEDFESLVEMLKTGKKDAKFINFLKTTLIPDLKKGGRVETAADFVTGLKYLKASTVKADEDSPAQDRITCDVPTFIRLLEFAREDANNDVDLHELTENAIALSKDTGVLTMEDYESLVPAVEPKADAPEAPASASVRRRR